MERGNTKFIKFIYLGTDLLLMGASFIAVTIILSEKIDESIKDYQSLFVIFLLIWVVSSSITKNYLIQRIERSQSVFFKILYTFSLHALLIFAFLVVFKEQDVSRLFLFYTYTLAGLLILGVRFLYYWLLKRYRGSGHNFKRVVIVGANSSSWSLYKFFEDNPYLGYQFHGFFDDDPEMNEPSELILGGLAELEAYCLDHQIEEIYYALSLERMELINQLSNFADQNFIYLKLLSDFRGLVGKKVRVDFYDTHLPVMTLRDNPLAVEFNSRVKRTFDVLFSSLVILLLFPVIFPIIAVIIKCNSKGPVFYKQLRNGKKNRLFLCYKFRTMTIDQPSETNQTTRNDPRLTSVGQFLRKHSLDELPQFFNVLIGDMSVVGPRPHMVKHTEEYGKIIDRYMIRQFVNPGITGYAQVNGYRGETREVRLMEQRVKYDVDYLENWSLALDFKIILLTVWNVFKGEDNAF